MATDLQRIVHPRSIAVIGASRTPGRIGHQIVANLLAGGFEGRVYPVHPEAREILGLPAFPTLRDVPGAIDVAIVCVPARAVKSVAQEAAEKRVAGLVVVSSGFAEVGNRADEEELVAIARAAGARVLGPNVVGLMTNAAHANASFAPRLPLPGGAAFVTQSGALLIALAEASYVRRVGMSAMLALGNMADVDFADAIDHFDQDPETTCIALYVEGFREGRAFVAAARRARKPIVALKTGTSARGAAAAASHTGSLAGAAEVCAGAFRQAGVVAAATLEDLLDRAQALALQPPFDGGGVLVVTNGGGMGVLAADAAERHGVPFDAAPEPLRARLAGVLPPFASAKNPVDMTGQAKPEDYARVIGAGLEDPWVRAVVVLFCETAVSDAVEVARAIERASVRARERGVPVVAAFVGGARCEEARAVLQAARVPFYADPANATSALAALREHGRFRARGPAPPFAPWPDVDAKAARAIVLGARAEGRRVLLEPEAKRVFLAYGLPVAPFDVATTSEEAAAIAARIDAPLAMKIVSPAIVHKTEAGGVVLGVRGGEAARAAYAELLRRARAFDARAEVRGVLVEPLARAGREVICGASRDPQFGPTVMLGLGGVLVEVLRDVAFRVAPIAPRDAIEMLGELRAARVLAGVRGEAPRDVERLSEIVSRLGELAFDLQDDVAEIDANPILVHEAGAGATVVDARIALTPR